MLVERKVSVFFQENFRLTQDGEYEAEFILAVAKCLGGSIALIFNRDVPKFVTGEFTEVMITNIIREAIKAGHEVQEEIGMR